MQEERLSDHPHQHQHDQHQHDQHENPPGMQAPKLTECQSDPSRNETMLTGNQEVTLCVKNVIPMCQPTTNIFQTSIPVEEGPEGPRELAPPIQRCQATWSQKSPEKSDTPTKNKGWSGMRSHTSYARCPLSLPCGVQIPNTRHCLED